jgi:hypothetical protein
VDLDPRIRTLRACADYLSEPHGGDREGSCLEASARAALELIGDLLAARDAPAPRGYKDACDKLADYGVCDPDLADRLKDIFDVADRVRSAWSTLAPGELEHACLDGSHALRELADAFERMGGIVTTPATS